MVELDNLARRLFIAGFVAVPVGVGLLWIAVGPSSAGEFQADAWRYVVHQARANPLLWLALAAFGCSLVGWIAAAARGRRLFSQQQRQRAVPAREVRVIGEDELVAKARAQLEPVLSARRPSTERVVDALLGVPLDLGASEVVLKPREMVVEVHLRVGLEQLVVTTMPPQLYADVLRRLRLIIAVDDLGDGQIELREGESVEAMRVVLQASVDGVQARLQVLRRTGFELTFAELGLPTSLLASLGTALDSASGLLLVSGLQGAGLTTTLYAAAHRIDRVRREPGLIGAVEPDVRLELPFVFQLEVGSAEPAALLRQLVERDHRVLVVRDIDHRETAKVALEEARSRLVLAGIAASDLPEALGRLAQHVGGALLADRLLVALGQRLVPRLCAACRRPAAPAPDQRARLGDTLAADDRFFEAAGCDVCGGSGFSGKQALFWLLEADGWLSDALKASDPAAALRNAAAAAGVDPLASVVGAAREGLVTLAQALDAARLLVGKRRGDG